MVRGRRSARARPTTTTLLGATTIPGAAALLRGGGTLNHKRQRLEA